MNLSWSGVGDGDATEYYVLQRLLLLQVVDTRVVVLVIGGNTAFLQIV